MRLPFTTASRARRFALAALAAPIAGLLAPAMPADAASGSIFVSEVAPWSSGNSAIGADWFEVTNSTGSAVDISGWKVDDSSAAFSSALALTGITSIGAGESVIFLESSTPAATAAAFISTWFGASAPSGLQIGTYSGAGIGLSTSGDAVNLYSAAGVLQTGVTFGASPAGPVFASFDNAAALTGPISQLSVIGTNGAFAAVNPISGTTTGQTGSPGTASQAAPPPTTTGPAPTTTTIAGPAYQPWPGSQSVATADDATTFVENLSGLDLEPGASAGADVLWATVNGPGTLFRLRYDTGQAKWLPDTANGWSAGKVLRYPNGTGDPDAEGVTFVGDASTVDGVYVATERNNASSGVSRPSILRFDPTAAGTTLTATNEWNLTADLPATGANLGLEAITWVDDDVLVANNFFDDAAGHTYAPADYPGHGTGLFFVGVEGSGMVYVYALRADNTFTRVTSFSAGFTPSTVMELQFDRDLDELWAVCDNSCNGRSHVLRIDSAGHFAVALRFERPTGMGNFNNEGFAIAPASSCVAGAKPALWADDADDATFSLRVGTIPCAALVTEPPVQVPEFPMAGLAIAGALVVLAAMALRRRPRGPKSSPTGRVAEDVGTTGLLTV